MSVFGSIRALTQKLFSQPQEQSFLRIFQQELKSKKDYPLHTNKLMLPPRKLLSKAIYDKITKQTKPRFVNGFWNKPRLSRLGLARLKKKYTLAGYQWPIKPIRDLSQVYENARTTFYHPDKIEKMNKIAVNMEKMPEWVEQFKERQRRDKMEDKIKNRLSDQEIYQRAINYDQNETPEWIQERIIGSDFKKAKRVGGKTIKKKK